jgi:hypothetical protein
MLDELFIVLIMCVMMFIVLEHLVIYDREVNHKKINGFTIIVGCISICICLCVVVEWI